MKSKPELTTKQQQLLNTIESFHQTHGFMPSTRDLASLLNIKSTNTIFSHVKALQTKGYLTKTPKGHLKPLSTTSFNRHTDIPLFGDIPAGFQAPATDAGRELISVDSYLIKNPQNTFALKVKGNSMEKAGIMPGDLILVEKRVNAKPNDIIVAHLPDGFTVKRYVLKNKQPHLQAESNSNYDIKLAEGTLIWGVVIGVIRKY